MSKVTFEVGTMSAPRVKVWPSGWKTITCPRCWDRLGGGGERQGDEDLWMKETGVTTGDWETGWQIWVCNCCEAAIAFPRNILKKD